MLPLISVIIPVYRHDKQLKLALASVDQQTYPQLEIIVVDDGNQPLLEISRSDSNQRVRCVRQNHKGAPAARNYGFSQSAGQYVIFWDADIEGKPGMIYQMYEVLQSHPEASYAYSNFYFGRKSMPAQPFSAAALRRMNYITSTSLIRRDRFLSWDESIHRFQDWDLWLTMLEKGYIGIWIPEYLFRIQPHRGGISRWLPRFAYQAPWRWLPRIRSQVNAYESARLLVQKKHRL